MPEPEQLPDVTDVALLVAVAETGSVAAGGRALSMSQPQASRSLRRLERQLGVRLLDRGARGSRLTPHGALVLEWAEAVLAANRRLVAGSASLSAERQRHLNVAASQTIAEHLLPRWLGALVRELPDLQVGVTVGNSSEVGALLGHGHPLVFVESPDVPASVSVPHHSRTVATDRLVVVVAPAHPWAVRTRPLSLAELAATPLVVREPGSGTRVSLEQALAGTRMAPPALELTSNAAVRIAVATGAGPAVLSEHAVEAVVARGELRAVMVEGLSVERPLRALWARGGRVPKAVRRLVEIAAAEAPG